jgi:mono/diheme cytochrome c family protein
MSQPTRSNEAYPIIPILVFFGIVAVMLFMLLPRSPQRALETASADTTDVAPSELPTQVAAAPTTETTTEATETSAEATEAPAEFDPASAYAFACSGCHGADGRGVEGIGPSLAFSSAVMSRDVSGLVAMFTNAQPPADPALGFVHPYRGGVPELTDEQLTALMDYLFTLVSG